MNPSELSELKSFSRFLAYHSGQIIKNYFRTDLNVDTKSDLSPVTIADKKSEEAMREVIMKEFPGHGILGEEFGIHNEGAEFQWVLDPIDGTKSFVCGAFSFGTLIALLKNGEPVIGVINQPVLGEFLIGDNKAAELNDIRVRVRDCRSVKDAVMVNNDHLNIEKYQNLEKFEKFMREVKLVRGWGDCYGYYLLASGYIDIMIDPIMSVWDSMALIPVVRGAGGIITDYQGNDAVKGTSIIAAGPAIHSEVIKALN